MGKRITQQARGKGSFTFRVRRKGYRYRISYPPLNFEGIGKIKKLINSAGHSAPLAEIEVNSTAPKSHDTIKSNLIKDKNIKPEGSEKSQSKMDKLSSVSDYNKDRKNKIKFIVPAADGVYEGQEIYIGKRHENKSPEHGDIVKLKDVKQGDRVFNIEDVPGKGGRILRSAGCSAIIGVKDKDVEIIIKRRRLRLNENCRAIFGTAAGEGRKTKPFVKAGKRHHLMKSKGRKWHRTSPVKVNAIDHPFGGGRGKRIKSKIAKRNAPAGAKVGHIRPRKTGRGK